MNGTFNDNVGRKRNAKASFTMIEMLAVISIIAILAGLMFPAYTNIKNTAKKAKARQDVTNLKLGLLAFRHEYGFWPDTSSANWTDLSSLLNGGTNPNTGVANTWATNNNFKTIRFMDFKPDQIADVSGQIAFIDPWGTPFAVLMDNGDGAIGKSGWTDGTAEDGQVNNPAGGNSIQSPVAVYSFGANKADNNGGADDVTSWGN